MSRIDEALKRVTRAPSPSPRRAESAESRATSFGDSSLDHYPAEHHSVPWTGEGREGNVEPPAPVRPEPAGRRVQLGPFDPSIAGKLVTGSMRPVSQEEYRRLAAVLHQMQAEHKVKTLMVTSALPREGKTLTVTNLALTLSEYFGRRVLLIDGDLRHPSIHEILGLPNTTGLGDGLRSERVQIPFYELSPTLTVLPAGPLHASSVGGLASNRMKAVIDGAAPRFDWVLVDTPPIGLLSDAQFLAGLVDGVLLVIGAAKTPYPLVQRAVAALGPDRLIGIVLNRVEEQTITADAYYRHYYPSSGAKDG